MCSKAGKGKSSLAAGLAISSFLAPVAGPRERRAPLCVFKNITQYSHRGDWGQLSEMPRGDSWELGWKKRYINVTKVTALEHCIATALPECSLLTNVDNTLY